MAAPSSWRLAEIQIRSTRGHPQIPPQAFEKTGGLPTAREIVSTYHGLRHGPPDIARNYSVLAATILKIAYGIDIDDENHEIIRMIDAALEGLAQAFVPGAFLVDVLPLLQYVPAWFPGAGFQRTFARWREATVRMKENLFRMRNTAFVRSDLVS